MSKPRRLKYYAEDGETQLDTVDFPKDTIVDGGDSATLIAYVTNPEPDEYEIKKVSHTDPNVEISLETGDGKILRPNSEKQYKLTLKWSPPEGNDKPLKGKIIIEGRFIIRY